MLHVENKHSNSFITNNIINPIINFGKTLFYLISEPLAQVAAIFSRLRTEQRASNQLTKGELLLTNFADQQRASNQLAKRELLLANFADQMSILSDNYIEIRHNPLVTPNILHTFNKTFFNTFEAFEKILNIVEEKKNDLLWEKHSVVIKNIVFSHVGHFYKQEKSDFNLDIFFTKLQTRAQEEEKFRHINLILALNSNEIPKLPREIRGYIFEFAKALLEKQEPEFAVAFYLQQKSYCNIQKCIEEQSI